MKKSALQVGEPALAWVFAECLKLLQDQYDLCTDARLRCNVTGFNVVLQLCQTGTCRFRPPISNPTGWNHGNAILAGMRDHPAVSVQALKTFGMSQCEPDGSSTISMLYDALAHFDTLFDNSGISDWSTHNKTWSFAHSTPFYMWQGLPQVVWQWDWWFPNSGFITCFGLNFNKLHTYT